MSSKDKPQQHPESSYRLGKQTNPPPSRLNFQHTLLHHLLGYTIHPSILHPSPLPHPTEIRIADIGAGTGQWLLDVHPTLPTAHLDGYDISAAQYPHSAWLPSNITLRQLDITKSIPPELEGMCDLVHVQLFLFVVGEDGPGGVLREVWKMLKPGGYLQWVEYEPSTFSIVSTDPNVKRTATEKFLNIMRGPNGKTTTWPTHLTSSFTTNNFTNVTYKHHTLPPELYAPFMQCHFSAGEEISWTVMDNDGPSAQGRMHRELLDEVYEEFRTGVTVVTGVVVVVGRKGG